MRRFADDSTVKRSYKIFNELDQGLDYRYESYGRKCKDRQRRRQVEIIFSKHRCALCLAAAREVPGDPSVRTYRGHFVRYTLIRCFFSPAFSTGQKYIVTGSSDGGIRSSYRVLNRTSMEFEFSFLFFFLNKNSLWRVDGWSETLSSCERSPHRRSRTVRTRRFLASVWQLYYIHIRKRLTLHLR